MVVATKAGFTRTGPGRWHAVGLPEQAMAHGSWAGIAFKLMDLNLVSEIGEILEILTIPPVTVVPDE